MTVSAATYRHAIDVLDERGWFKGELCDADGKVCMVGAVLVAAGVPLAVGPDGVPNEPVGEPLNTILRDLSAATGQALPGLWNDEPSRTVGQVKAVLAGVADRYERSGVSE
jgi:hypothetical protein